MKPATVALVGLGAVAVYLLCKQRKAALGDDLLLPPPGRTVDAGGQVLNGIQVYDAAPYQYRREAVNDFVPGLGWGGSIGKAVKRSVSSAKKVVKSPSKAITTPPKAIAKAAKQTGAAISKAAKQTGAVISRTAQQAVSVPTKLAYSALKIVFPPKQSSAGGKPVYQDANGNTISAAEYKRQMAEAKKYTPKKIKTYKKKTIWTQAQEVGGVIYIVNLNPKTMECEAIFATLKEATNFIDGVPAATQDVVTKDVTNVTVGPTNTTSTANTYSAEQAAAEEASLGPAVDSSSWSEGATPLPEVVQSVQTPSMPEAVEVPVEEPKKSKTGLIVGGTALAAVAALFLSR